MDRLRRLHDEFGQSPWLDNLARGYVTSGRLVRLREAGVRGLTSNPTIFQKAIDGAVDYDEQFRTLRDRPVEEAYWAMVLADIGDALDVFAPVYADSHGQDGFVSVEVSPALAHDVAGTAAAARMLWDRVARPNLMVKIPATEAGLPAIRQMIAEGRNINVTLIFTLKRYHQVMEAYLAGLEDRAAATTSDLSGIASVASFFISRVDTEVDRRLETLGSPAALARRGTAAVAQAKLAYRAFQDVFSGPRWDALVARGAQVQRPLWASTSTKNPAYPDTRYVDELIGPDTVNTLPDATLDAFADHGRLARTIDADLDRAVHDWRALTDVGVDLADVGRRLEADGLAAFSKSFDDLLASLTAKADRLR
jgi:transaldolase